MVMEINNNINLIITIVIISRTENSPTLPL